VTAKVQMFLTSNQFFKRKGISFFCVLQEEGQGEVLTRFWFAPLCSPCSANGFFFPVCAKKNNLKEEGQSLELSNLWGQSSFKQCSFQSNSKILK
jgi:hypothetical protein